MKSPKRILFLADINSTHTRKWAELLVQQGFALAIFSLNSPESDWPHKNDIQVFSDTFKQHLLTENSPIKLSYLFSLPRVKRAIKKFNPDIVHSHYATSYGLLGVLSGFKPLIISVWGADIFNFPHTSFLHKSIIKHILKKSSRILSTSKIMKEEIKKYSTKDITVTPFGVDMEVFKNTNQNTKTKKEIVIGTVKMLEEKYGIDILIRAFASIKQNIPEKIKLLIVGDGTKAQAYKSLTKQLGIEREVIFTGKIPTEQVAEYHNRIDIFVAVSIEDSESFGVSVIEAMACETPVIVSQVGGLQEVVENNVSGIFVQPKNIQQTANAIISLINNPEKANQLGKNGRIRVKAMYDLQENLKTMIDVYNNVLNS